MESEVEEDDDWFREYLLAAQAQQQQEFMATQAEALRLARRLEGNPLLEDDEESGFEAMWSSFIESSEEFIARRTQQIEETVDEARRQVLDAPRINVTAPLSEAAFLESTANSYDECKAVLGALVATVAAVQDALSEEKDKSYALIQESETTRNAAAIVLQSKWRAFSTLLQAARLQKLLSSDARRMIDIHPAQDSKSDPPSKDLELEASLINELEEDEKKRKELALKLDAEEAATAAQSAIKYLKLLQVEHLVLPVPKARFRLVEAANFLGGRLSRTWRAMRRRRLAEKCALHEGTERTAMQCADLETRREEERRKRELFREASENEFMLREDIHGRQIAFEVKRLYERALRLDAENAKAAARSAKQALLRDAQLAQRVATQALITMQAAKKRSDAADRAVDVAYSARKSASCPDLSSMNKKATLFLQQIAAADRKAAEAAVRSSLEAAARIDATLAAQVAELAIQTEIHRDAEKRRTAFAKEQAARRAAFIDLFDEKPESARRRLASVSSTARASAQKLFQRIPETNHPNRTDSQYTLLKSWTENRQLLLRQKRQKKFEIDSISYQSIDEIETTGDRPLSPDTLMRAGGRGKQFLDLAVEQLSGSLAVLSSCSRLRALSLNVNGIDDSALLSALRAAPHLEWLSVRDNKLRGRMQLRAPRLCALHADVNCLGPGLGSFLTLPRLRRLSACENKIQVVDALPPRLERLDLAGNVVQSIDLSCCYESLTWLDMSRNRLSKLDFKGISMALPSLEVFNLTENKIQFMTGIVMSLLRILKLDDNKLSDTEHLSDSWLPCLDTLSVRGNCRLQRLPAPEATPNLSMLGLAHTGVTKAASLEIALQRLPLLRRLELAGTPLVENELDEQGEAQAKALVTVAALESLPIGRALVVATGSKRSKIEQVDGADATVVGSALGQRSKVLASLFPRLCAGCGCRVVAPSDLVQAARSGEDPPVVPCTKCGMHFITRWPCSVNTEEGCNFLANDEFSETIFHVHAAVQARETCAVNAKSFGESALQEWEDNLDLIALGTARLLSSRRWRWLLGSEKSSWCLSPEIAEMYVIRLQRAWRGWLVRVSSGPGSRAFALESEVKSKKGQAAASLQGLFRSRRLRGRIASALATSVYHDPELENIVAQPPVDLDNFLPQDSHEDYEDYEPYTKPHLLSSSCDEERPEQSSGAPTPRMSTPREQPTLPAIPSARRVSLTPPTKNLTKKPVAPKSPKAHAFHLPRLRQKSKQSLPPAPGPQSASLNVRDRLSRSRLRRSSAAKGIRPAWAPRPE